MTAPATPLDGDDLRVVTHPDEQRIKWLEEKRERLRKSRAYNKGDVRDDQQRIGRFAPHVP